MARRTRFIAGILAFLALTFSIAESVWASTCAPGMEMDVPAEMASHEGADESHMAERSVEGERGDDDEESRDCPFGDHAAVQTCVGALSLPAVASVFFIPSLEDAAGVFTLQTQSDLLLESALYRPPRA